MASRLLGRLLDHRRSLRFRLTALVTLLVGAVLALAAVGLVLMVERTLIGQARSQSAAEVEQVAEMLADGRPLEGAVRTTYEFGMRPWLVLVQDPDGEVVQSSPQGVTSLAVLPGDEGSADAAGLGEESLQARLRAGGADPNGVPTDRVAMFVNGETYEDMVIASQSVHTPEGERTVSVVSPLAPAMQSVATVVNALLIATPLLTLLLGGLTWFAVDRALRPMEAVRARAEAISHSTLGERLPQRGGGDEVERLTSTLNSMLERLESGARRQREFVSDASHELRTPLAVMRAELEIHLAHGDASGWRDTAGRMLEDHHRLERLTEDLLALARLEDAGGPQNREPVRVDEAVAAELAAVRRTVCETVLEPACVEGDYLELVRLVRNLLDNADRHARCQVRARTGTEGGSAVIAVDDDGPGIPAGQRERVFERFVRLDEGRDRERGGTGLGLALVRRIAQAHGGEVTVLDSPLGGARFEVRLPALRRG